MLTRFAPSPTGYLHIGHALAATEAFGASDCLLRIEDIDHTRCRPEFTQAIYQDLDWLGFEWPAPVRVQSDHYQDYAKVIADLIARRLAYPCTLSRAEIKAGERSDPETGLTAGEFLRHFPGGHAAPSLPYAIRLNLRAALEAINKDSLFYSEVSASVAETIDAGESLSQWRKSDRPDPIIARKDIGVSYHIAVTHDDAAQGISHIVRGADFINQTPLHILLQRLMGWPTPTYHHHILLLREDGEKLSKRTHDTTIRSLREKGMTPQEVLAMANA